MAKSSRPPVVLFGYDTSPFTLKVRFALKIKGVKHYYVQVPSMLPRPVLRDAFSLTYRKIPVAVIGNDLYCDTSIILEALEYYFPESEGYRSLYPTTDEGRTYRPMIRGFASYWTDRPLFRVATGLIPGSVWRTAFGTDRMGLIGHKLDPDKLEKKIPRNLASFDMQLSYIEPMCQEATKDRPWLFPSQHPSLADIHLYYQLYWIYDISAGRGIHDLTGGGTPNTNEEVAGLIMNKERYPAFCAWYNKFAAYLESLPSVETNIGTDATRALEAINAWAKQSNVDADGALLPTPRSTYAPLAERNGIVKGAPVSVAPDDTGREDPTVGKLLATSPEETIIKAQELDGKKPLADVRVHFPTLGFVVTPLGKSKL